MLNQLHTNSANKLREQSGNRDQILEIALKLEKNGDSKKKEGEMLSKQREFIQLIIDFLSLNHETYNIVDDTFMCSLGEPRNITETGMKSLASHCGENTPCIEMIKRVTSYLADLNKLDQPNDGNNNDNDSDSDSSESSSVAKDSDDDDDDDDDNDDDVVVTSTSKSDHDNDAGSKDKEGEFIQLLTTYVNMVANNNNNNNNDSSNSKKLSIKDASNGHCQGFLFNSDYLRAIIDAIKCRIKLDPLLLFDFGMNSQLQLNPTDLVALLLEICDQTVHKKVWYFFVFSFFFNF